MIVLRATQKQNRFLFWILTFVNTTSFCLATIGIQLTCLRKDYVHFVMQDFSQVSHSSDHSCEPEMNSASGRVTSDSTALAVVLYKEDTLLPHEKKSRSFKIADQEFYIEQNWHEGGVAAVVWDAALVLGDYLASNKHLVQDKHVLELGAGTGLAGMVASSLGADVIVTEREQAMSYLETAVSANKAGKDWKIIAAVLDWTHDIHSNSNGWEKFDFVIGADIVYIEETFPHLLKTLKSVAASSTTTVLLSCRIRYDRDLQFFNMLKEFFSVEEIFYNSKLDIKIFSAISKS